MLLQVLSKVFQLSPGKEAWSWWSTCRHSWIGQRQLQVVHIFHNLQRRLFIFLSQSTQFQFNSVPQSIISQPGLPKQPWRANLAPTPGRILASSALRLSSSWHQCALRRAAQGEATLVEGEEQCEAALLRVHSSATWQGRRGRKRKGRAVTTMTPTWRISVNFCSVQLLLEYMNMKNLQFLKSQLQSKVSVEGWYYWRKLPMLVNNMGDWSETCSPLLIAISWDSP